MTKRPTVEFKKTSAGFEQSVVLLVGDKMSLGRSAKSLDEQSGEAISRAANAVEFSGKLKTTLEIPGAADIDIARVILIGIGAPDEHAVHTWAEIGARCLPLGIAPENRRSEHSG